MIKDNKEKKENTVIETDENLLDGQNKCPKCGATDISLNSQTGKLRCNFCRHEFVPEKIDSMEKDISKLSGKSIGSGAADISFDEKDVLTLKCTSCGAEVIIDTSVSAQARCHWCRNTLSINNKLPNGAIPDAVLPFKISKNDAKNEIEKFVRKRRFYAHPMFKKEFQTDNIMGVYLPYMIINANTYAKFDGQGEQEIKRYKVKNGDNEVTYYDANLYDVSREFDLTIEGLTIESSKDKLNTSDSSKTNNIINSIMPFDTENCVKWNANYIKGYTSEKRDTNISDLGELVEAQSRDIARFACNKTLEKYDRGVRWDSEELRVKGEEWKSAYLPVWLYSYRQEKKEGKSILHYVAVNARTKETMGSVPIHIPKLVIVSFIIEILGLIAMLLTLSDNNDWPYFFLSSGPIYYVIIYAKYRNTGARHKHELETKTNMTNLKKHDRLVRKQTRLTNQKMTDANNTNISSINVKNQMNKKNNM